jgi:hypothetical protein
MEPVVLDRDTLFKKLRSKPENKVGPGSRRWPGWLGEAPQ